jgi:hypothetical protein
MPEPDAPYKVGYGRPPKSAQFAKGKSGNPKGRPKGSKNLAAVVLRESRQRVRVNGPGRTRSVTKLEAAVIQLNNKAAQGDLRAQRELFFLVQRSEDAVNSEVAPLSLHEMDQRVIETLRRRMEGVKAEPVSTSESASGEEQK